MKPLHFLTLGLTALLVIPAITVPASSASTPSPRVTERSPIVQLAQRRRRSLSWRVGVRPSKYRIGGFSRSGTCPNQAKITAFVPPPLPEESIKTTDGAIDSTLSARPTFWVYVANVPKNAQVQFTLQDEVPKTTDADLYNIRFRLDGETGILGISLPPTVRPLQVGQRYVWQMRIQCDETLSSDSDPIIGSWIQRISPDQIKATPEFDPKPLVQALETATPLDKPALYAALGIWQDAVTSLIALQQKQPDNQELREDWRSLLTDAQMREFLNTPLLGVK